MYVYIYECFEKLNRWILKEERFIYFNFLRKGFYFLVDFFYIIKDVRKKILVIFLFKNF